VVLADSVCGSSCTDFNESFNRVLNELDFLKNKVQNLEAQNSILENKIKNLEQNSMLAVNYLELKENIEKLETKTDNRIECIILNTEANTQRLEDVHEVNYSFKLSRRNTFILIQYKKTSSISKQVHTVLLLHSLRSIKEKGHLLF